MDTAMQHGHGHAALTLLCSMDMDMHRGHAHWICSCTDMDIDYYGTGALGIIRRQYRCLDVTSTHVSSTVIFRAT
jgi:hypothetical protein